MKKILLQKAFTAIVLSCFSMVQAFAGPGMHGPRTISTANVIVNEFTALTANATAGGFYITVASSSLNANNRFAGNLTGGELLMIIQVQGATMNTSNVNLSSWGDVTAYNNAGKFEFNEVLSVLNATTIRLVNPLTNSYTASGHVEVIRVPRYTSLTINTGASLTTQPWNGQTGGVAAAEVSGTAIINGTIDVTGLGFRGGVLKQISQCCPSGTGIALTYATINNDEGAAKGEGIGGDTTAYDLLGGRYGRGAPANGGGGGNCHNAGGGGGSNAANGVAWNGFGNPDTVTDPTWIQAWDLDGATLNFHRNVSSGGGRGGYTYAQRIENPLTFPPCDNQWHGDDRCNVGGYGGRPLNNSGRRIFMGGGGGAGDANNNLGSAGAPGGGIIYLIAGSATGNGFVNANGADAQPSLGEDAPGGGGGGGTVILYGVNITANHLSLNAAGGKGGTQSWANTSGESEGAGGGGGGGIAATSSPQNMTLNTKGGKNGTSLKMPTFLPNGATSGGGGATLRPLSPYAGPSFNRPENADIENIFDESSSEAAYPNPFTSSLRVEYFSREAGTAELQLSNLFGQAVRTEILNSNEGVNSYILQNLSALPAGVYFLSVNTAEEKQTVRIVKF
jgi:hypothetical protein